MTATTFNLLEAAGAKTRQAEAIVSEMREAAGARHSRGELVICGGLCRALWIQGAGIVADRASVLLTTRPEYGFSQGKLGVAMGERERRLTPTIA